jgi:hypothetical protein
MKSSWITENDLDAARANVLLAQSLAAAHWDPKNVVLGDDVVAKATELVIPDGTQTWARDPHLTDMSPYQNGLFAKTTRLKRLVVGDVDFPTYYFAYL